MSTNGLDMLNQERAKRTQDKGQRTPFQSKRGSDKSARSVPPPLHAPKAPTPSTGAVTNPPISDPTSAPAPAATKPATAPAPEEELKRVTVYLGEDAVEAIDAVLSRSKHMKPRVNSGSAVIRLALSRLSDQLTPQQTAEILCERAAMQQSPGGRKRI